MASITKIIHEEPNIETLTDLGNALRALLKRSPVSSGEAFFERPFGLKLIEDVLSDGSKVYNIAIEVEE